MYNIYQQDKPDDEVKLWEGKHDDTEGGREGAVEHRRQHLLKRHGQPHLPATQATDKSLNRNIFILECSLIIIAQSWYSRVVFGNDNQSEHE